MVLLGIQVTLAPAASAAPAPIAAYSFDEGTGTTLGDSAGSHNGTISGASWTSSGKYGSALSFDGRDDLVSIADAADLDLTRTFTLEAWVYRGTSASGGVVLQKGERPLGTSGYLLNSAIGDTAAGYTYDSGTTGSVAGFYPVPTETWTHLAFTSDGTTFRLYINGEPVNESSAVAAKASSSPLLIGHNPTLGGYFGGKIDEVRIYDESLSHSQVRADRDSAVGVDQVPIAAYSFDEGAGSTLNDSAGSHDGTISGATWTSSGKYGSALDFDGRDDLVSVADAADLDLTNSFTLEAWVQPDSLINWSPVIEKGTVGPLSSGYGLYAHNFTLPRGYISDASGVAASTAGRASLPTGSWSHLAFSYDGANLRLYVDGVLQNTTATSLSMPATTAALKIAHSPIFRTYFDGRIDEVRLYDEPLSQTQIQADADNRVQAPAALREVTATALDTGPTSELVSSVPITSAGDPRVVYSLAIPSIGADEVLRASANLEVTNTHSYDVTDSVRLLLGSSATDTNGTVVTPWTSVRQTPDMYHWTLPLSGVYHATSSPGTQYLKVILKAASTSAVSGDTLTVQPNFGRLAATRYTPASGPMSQPTHQLQPQIGPLPELVRTIPVDSAWQRVMTRKVSPLSCDDILDIAAQLEVQNTSNATVRLESKITYSSAPSTGGSIASPLTTDRLTSDMSVARIVHGSDLQAADPTKLYLNLLVRAVPDSGTPSPLTLTAGTATLNVLRFKLNPGDPTAGLGEGTTVEARSGPGPDVSSIPYGSGSASQPRVVAHATLYGGLWKGEVIHARGLITGDLAGADTAQLLTKLVLADSPTATTGDTVGVFSGDKIPIAAQVRTVLKEGTYVVPRVEETMYVNLVAWAGGAANGKSMTVEAASVDLTRSKPTAPLDEGFEDGLDGLFKYEYEGPLSATSEVAREGTKSMLANLDFSRDFPQTGDFHNLRVQARPPDTQGTGGQYGTERWHGFSVHFDENFNVGPDVARFTGRIDEVRLYDQPLTEAYIESDMSGSYEQSPEPVAAYSFEEGSGTTAIDSAGDHDGTIDGASWTVSGKIGTALEFDGGQSQVIVPDSAELDLTGSFTLEAWVRPEDEISVWSPIISKAEHEGLRGYRLNAEIYPTNNEDWQELGRTAGTVGASDEEFTRVQDSDHLPLDTWSHVALTYDGSDLSLFVDGELVASAAEATVGSNDSDLTIGGADVPATPGGQQATLATHFAFLKRTSEPWLEPFVSNCPAAAIPVMFSAWRFNAAELIQAGLVVNPTGIEYPDSPEDYIIGWLAGGEVNSSCEVDPPREIFVLAPLQRERWYDFVLHTHWTPTPLTGKSVTEIWIDGDQILGDESHPISHPTLPWYSSPYIHATEAFFQFGIYRHISASNPTSKLYIDAVRTGNSYSEVVPGQ